MEKSLFFVKKTNIYVYPARPFFLEIRKFIPCNKRHIIEEFNENFPSFISQDYENIEEIGKGCQGKVYKVRDKRTNLIKAIKCMKTRDLELISQVNIIKKI